MIETLKENQGGCFGQEIEIRVYQARGSGTTKSHEQKTTQQQKQYDATKSRGRLRARLKRNDLDKLILLSMISRPSVTS